MPPRKLTKHSAPEAKMAIEDLGNLEWERSKISQQDINMLKKLGISGKQDALRFPKEEAIQPRQCNIGVMRLRLLFLPFLKVENSKKGLLSPMTTRVCLPESEAAGSRKSASSRKERRGRTSSTRSPPSAASPRSKRKRTIVDTGTSKAGAARAEETVPDARKKALDLYEAALISSGDEEEDAPIDETARTSTSRTLVVSEAHPDGDETSPPQQNPEHPTPTVSPQAPSPKRARVELAKEPTILTGCSSTPLMEEPFMKELIRFGTQFIGYREYAAKLEEKLAEANKRADALAAELEQSESMKAEADAAAVEDLQKRLDDAKNALSENVAQHSAREEEILSRLESQSRRSVRRTNQEYELESPEGDQLLDALSLLEIHGTEARDGLAKAKIGLSRLFPYFFKKKEEPAIFIDLAKCFSSQEDLGLQLRQEGLKVGVEDVGQVVPKCLAKMAKRKKNFSKYDDVVTPVAEDMMDELLRMDAEFCEGQLC
ncbi:hypothetical protein QYE76_064754 [Lolium multiflorum]|uniref:Uncharacterized protein n=1 Tax=Lolium multiflorum TaxID=4521 RepID=A0AAD8S7G3_LOLMU|nr:hypothetical protein QYE76_064754 [Lolium multiflorum]